MKSALALVIALTACTADPYATKGAPEAAAEPAKAAPEAKAEPEPEAKAEPEPKPKPEAKPAAAPAKQVQETVVLAEAGAEPRQALAWQPKGTQTLTLVIDMALGMTMPNKDVPSTVIPSIASELEVRTLDTGDKVQLQWRIGKSGVGEFDNVSPDVVKAVGQAAFELEKAKGAIETTPQGLARKVAIDAKGLTNPTLRPTLTAVEQSFVQLFPALPADPVGKGARWTATTEGFVSGFPIKQEATYTLKSRKGNIATLAVELTQTDRDEGHLIQTKGNGTITLDLAKPAPSAADIKSKAKIQSQAVAMDMTLALKLE